MDRLGMSGSSRVKLRMIPPRNRARNSRNPMAAVFFGNVFMRNLTSGHLGESTTGVLAGSTGPSHRLVGKAPPPNSPTDGVFSAGAAYNRLQSFAGASFWSPG